VHSASKVPNSPLRYSENCGFARSQQRHAAASPLYFELTSDDRRRFVIFCIGIALAVALYEGIIVGTADLRA
jgi:hypothetical protein